MSSENGKGCFIARCLINGHDSSGGSANGLLLCAVSAGEVLYCGAMFSHEPIDPDISLSDALSLLDASRPDGDYEGASSYESGLMDFVRNSRIFQSDKGLTDPKALEHRITYFCSSNLSLNAISFLEIHEMTDVELRQILPRKGNHEREGEDGAEEAGFSGDGAPKEGVLPDVVVACDPVLNPVGGVPVSELTPGETIYCKLRVGSVFYNLMESASPNFDGVITGDVTAVSVSDLGSATVALKLSDGVTGAMKVASTVRLKSARKDGDALPAHHLPDVEVFIAIGGVILFLTVMAALLYLLS
jgi:hypothetical protein